MQDPAIGNINHVTLSVGNLDRSLAFYTQVLGCKPLARWRRGAYLLAGGATWICLSLDDDPSIAPAAGYTHMAFSVTPGALAQLTRRLDACGAARWQENASEGDSIYFLDPDGHKLELHVGDWCTRLDACRARPYDGMVFY